MFAEITIFVGIPFIFTIILFIIKASSRKFPVKLLLYLARSISLSVLVFLVLLFFFPRYFGYIFDPFDVYRPNENTSVIPTVSFPDLEKVSNLTEKYEIRFIETTQTGYIFYGEKMIPLLSIKDENLSRILVQNNIAYVDNHLDMYTSFSINESNRIFTLEKKGVSGLKKGDIRNDGKITRILNDKWILLDKCTRNNCPELDK